MSRKQNHIKKTNSSSENFSETIEVTSSSDDELTIRGGARPKITAFNLTKKKSTKMSGKTSSKLSEDKFRTDIKRSKKKCDVSVSNFHEIYKVWILKRIKVLHKLKELLKNVHEDQLSFNSTSLLFKQMNVGSRRLKTMDGSNTDFYASLATVVTDAISAVTSVAQACNVDSYMEQFRDIMNNDAEFTKPLYDARSNCFSEYKDVEEIVRRYHSETFGSTFNKISDSLKLEDMWLDIKSSRSEGVTQILETCDNFFRQISNAEVFHGIYKSIENYVDSNPAVLDACESTGKTLYGIYDTWGQDPKKNSLLVKNISMVTNQAIIRRGETEISRLRSMVNDEDMSQANLESRIRNALEGLEAETKEIKNLYKGSLNFVPSFATDYTNYNNEFDDHYNYDFYSV